MSSLRETWAAGGETLGLWLGLPDPVSAEIAGRQPVDYVCVDTQHGAIDHQTSMSLTQAIELGGGSPLVRVPWNDPGIIGKALDAGAHGVIVPMVNTRAQAETVVQSVRYPPLGARSWGPMIASMRHGDYRAWAADHIAVIPMIETVEALDNLDGILSVPGIDAVYVGPADLSLSLGLGPAYDDCEAAFADALEAVVAACHRHGVVAGIHASGSLAGLRRQQGFRMITITEDVAALHLGFGNALAAARSLDDAGDSRAMY